MKEAPLRALLLPSMFSPSATAVGHRRSQQHPHCRVSEIEQVRLIPRTREADGATISQLITDFGRSTELTRSAKLHLRSQQMNVQATRAQILLEVNNAYFSALESQSVIGGGAANSCGSQIGFGTNPDDGDQ